VTLVFEHGTTDWSTMEAPGRDYGLDVAGFTNNSVLGQLIVGGDSPAMLRLIDQVNNDSLAPADAVYVHDLFVRSGSTLDLNGLHLYYDGNYVNEGSVIGGQPLPEPGLIALLSMGLPLVRRRRPAR